MARSLVRYWEREVADRHFCGCCGEEIGAGTGSDPQWCARCKNSKGHLGIGPDLIAPWRRTYFARFRRPCPWQV